MSDQPQGAGAPQADGESNLDAVLLRVGRLNYAWSNTESLLIHLLAGLSGMEQDAAVVVFLSVSSTRGRIEMVERLAKLRLPEGEEQSELLELTARFTKLSAVRNRYNHSIWSFEDDGSVSTILMRIADRRNRIHMGKRQNLGGDELSRLDQDLDMMSGLNRNIWQFLAKYDYPIS
ncbi:hypothetical protein [Paracoccus aerodenitrificans]|uniref:hypothetical protein n=1 Tax=Paracoccus aerodenitrificans TaxID=3017781 RepID=UPI0022F1147A|nr:hypothetical protein [Paracoccus aerodenitrificans]WBU64449.1 hypothetical protein PAE61_03110 [Paracoccus aerodenitrificans]